MTGRSVDGSYHDVILVVVIACSVSVGLEVHCISSEDNTDGHICFSPHIRTA